MGHNRSKYKPEGFDRRQSFTRQTECPFALTATRDAELEIWTLHVQNPDHKHEATLACAHPVHRKNAVTKKAKNTIITQTRINSSTKIFFFDLRLEDDEKNSIVKVCDIYNIRVDFRRESLGPHSAVQALMVKLSKRED